jgi:cation transport protein ChaC
MMMMLTPELVALTLRDVQDDGPEPGWTPLSETELDCLVDLIQGEAGVEPIWVFAYGSLIWNPEFNVTGRMRATAYGWHRSFSLKIERWRATSEQPGLMMALERGGRCDGMVLRLSNETAAMTSALSSLVKSSTARSPTWSAGYMSTHLKGP